MDTNKTNFDSVMLSRIRALNGKRAKLLLHCCCAPCALYPLTQLMPHFDITLYYFNPNIRPDSEYQKRKAELTRIAGFYGLPMTEGQIRGFDEVYLGREQEAEGGERCRDCIRLRLCDSAKKAEQIGAEYFSTTLTVSPHKDADFINREGIKLSKQGLIFLETDFKKRGGFAAAGQLCRMHQVYRQNYCGCTPKSES